MSRVWIGCVCGLIVVSSPSPRAQPDSRAVAALIEAANTAISAGRTPEALRSAEAALDAAERSGSGLDTARARHALGRAQRLAGQYAQAAASQAAAAAAFAVANDAPGEADARREAGESLRMQGRLDDARREFERAVLVARPVSATAEAGAHAGLASVLALSGRLPEARAALQQALALLRQASAGPQDLSIVLTRLGIVARQMGAFDEGLRYYDEAAALARTAGQAQFEAQTLSNAANLLRDLGEVERATEMYRRAQEIYAARQEPLRVAVVQRSLAATLVGTGRRDRARQFAEDAVATFRRSERPTDLAVALIVLARVRLVDFEDAAGARVAADEAAALARANGLRQIEAEAEGHLADALLTLGHHADAVAHAARAFTAEDAAGLSVSTEIDIRLTRARALRGLGRLQDAVDDLRAAARLIGEVTSSLRSDRTRRGFLDANEQVFTGLADTLYAAGAIEAALEAAEAGRAQAMTALLASRRARVRPNVQPALDAVRASVDRVNALERGTAEYGTAAAALERDLAALGERDRELSAIVTAASPTVEVIREAARGRGATVVEYLVARDAVLAWVVGPDGALHAARVPLERASLEQQVRAVRADIDAGRVAPGLRALHDSLIGPLATWLPVDTAAPVIVVPHGVLHLVPFSALTDSRGRPLVARHTLAVVPSVGVLLETSRKRQTGSRPALVVADPATADPALARLPGARLEGRRVGARLGATTTVLGGARGTEAAVRALAPGAGLLHFATHAVLSEREPASSALALAPDGDDDGFLRADEIMSLDVAADLVVLSGCSTGAGPLSADGVIGLVRAFIYAGTPAVVASQWDVPDRATAFLMDRFYQERARGQSVASALRLAQLATRSQYPAPRAWAGFHLVGEPR